MDSGRVRRDPMQRAVASERMAGPVTRSRVAGRRGLASAGNDADRREKDSSEAPQQQFVLHPYLETVSPRRSRDVNCILRAEQRVLRLLERLSGWRVFPRGPRQSYTTADVSPVTVQVQNEATGSETHRAVAAFVAAADVACNLTRATQADPDRAAAVPCISATVQRVVTLTLNDLTVYALLEVLDNYLHHSRRGNRNNRPALPNTPPLWEMPADIAVLDQLQTMELFHCTGELPDTVNYLTRLQTLKLKSCHNLRLQNLRGLQSLTEVDITDSENVLPSHFANLPLLERLKLYRIASSDANTNAIGKDWIADLRDNYDDLKWARSLKDFCICSAGLSNDDFATLMVDVLCNDSNNQHKPAKFPNLRSIFIISNPDITSFQPLLERWGQQYQIGRKRELLASPTSNFVPPPLRVLSLTGTRIDKTFAEMTSILRFLQAYTEIGLFMMVKLPDSLRNDVVQCVHRINHQLTINRAGGPALLTWQEGNGAEDDKDSTSGGHQRRRRPVPLSLWPLLLERAMNTEYVACYESVEDRSQSIRRRVEQVVARGEAVMRRVDHVVARARAILGNDNDNNNGNGNGNGANDDDDDDDDDNNNHLVRQRNILNHNLNRPPLRRGRPLDPHDVGRLQRLGNQERATSSNTNDNAIITDWMEDSQTFSNRSRYDAVFHLLRNGPVLLATGEHEPRCRRQRPYVPRKCKRVKLF